MDSFANKIAAVGVACIFCGLALAGQDQGDHMKMMDANGDGKVTAAEHTAGAQKMFTKMDSDGDGLVTAAEMDAAHPMMKHKDAHSSDAKMHGDKMGKMMSSTDKIAKLDTNKDGKLSAAEHAAGAKQMFSKMDKDSDGSLTAQELRDGHRSMMTASDE